MSLSKKVGFVLLSSSKAGKHKTFTVQTQISRLGLSGVDPAEKRGFLFKKKIMLAINVP